MSKIYDIIHLGEHSYVVDKEAEIKEGNWTFYIGVENEPETYKVFKIKKITERGTSAHTKFMVTGDGRTCDNKVIASSDPSLSLPLLPAIEENNSSLEDIIAEIMPRFNTYSKSNVRFLVTAGYKAAKLKKYTEENIKKTYVKGWIDGSNDDTSDVECEKLLESLTPLPVQVEVEMTYQYKVGKEWKSVLLPSEWSDKNAKREVPKVENNTLKVVKWII